MPDHDTMLIKTNFRNIVQQSAKSAQVLVERLRAFSPSLFEGLQKAPMSENIHFLFEQNVCSML